MADDIKARLQDYGVCLDPNTCICDRRVVDEAVARIAELEGENARLHALAKANNDLARHEGSGRKSAMREITTLRDALAGLMPDNLGVIPTSMADSDILPLDVSIGELRRAHAALNQEKNNG